jgi:hypothetical protein
MLFERKGRNASGANKKPRSPQLELKLNNEAAPTDESIDRKACQRKTKNRNHAAPRFDRQYCHW